MKNYVAKYFLNTKKITKNHDQIKKSIVSLQFFQWNDNVKLCGIDLVLEFLTEHTNTSKYRIKYLPDGSIINGREVVLELKGEYKYFGIYEGVIDGILSRATSIATNAWNVKKVANGKKLIFMGDRADYYLNQKLDGYAAAVGGIETQVTKMQTSSHEGEDVGTTPHVLIQMFKGDLISAMHAFKDFFPDERLIALVDFNNDVINDSLALLKEFKKELYGVRVDTSPSLVDKYFDNKKKKEHGVNITLIKALRLALDKNYGKHVKIFISSGLDAQKIKEFETAKTPIDGYGIGAALLKINYLFTADAVKIDDEKIAKVGRQYQKNSRLKTY